MENRTEGYQWNIERVRYHNVYSIPAPTVNLVGQPKKVFVQPDKTLYCFLGCDVPLHNTRLDGSQCSGPFVQANICR